MTLSDIILEMELGGVNNEDISEIVNLYKEGGLTVAAIDEILSAKGYEAIFTVDYDDYDFDDYNVQERNHYKREWDD